MTIYKSRQDKIGKSDCSKMEEIPNHDIEGRFTLELAEELNNILNIPYNERRITRQLFVSSLKQILEGNRKGLLYEYEQYLFDRASERLIDTFKLKSDVNYNFATHARFADIVDEIKGQTKKKNGR